MFSGLFGSSPPTIKTVENVNTPFFADVKDGIPRDSEIEIQGQVLSGNDQAIWFEYRNFDGIPLHLNIRMGANKEHKIVVNSYDRGRWRREQREDLNVAPGGPINLSIINHSSKFEIVINGKKFNFSHRLSPRDIKRMEIRGDIRIDRITFKNLDNHIQLYQSGQSNQPSQPVQNNFPPQPSFNPAPYVPSTSPDPVLAGSGSTITSPGYQPYYPSEPLPNQPAPNQDYPPYPGSNQGYQPYPNQPGPNSMYPNL